MPTKPVHVVQAFERQPHQLRWRVPQITPGLACRPGPNYEPGPSESENLGGKAAHDRDRADQASRGVMLPIRTCAGQPVPKRRFSERRSLRVRDARCSFRLRTDPVVSTDTIVLAVANGMLRDALTCIQAVMHATPTRTMIRPDSITVALDPSATKGFTKRFMEQAPTRGAAPRAPETMGGPAPARSPEGGSNLLGRWRGTGSSGGGFPCR